MLTNFLELFNPLPGNHYLEVTTEIDDITYSLENLLKGVDGELNLAFYNESDLDIKSLYPNLKLQHINSFKKPYRAVPRHYDVVIFKDFFHKHQNKSMVLKIAYTTLANTADIIIMEKKGIMDVEAIKELLDEYEFRAVNDIDLLPQYDLVMGKKMHMWGNGL